MLDEARQNDFENELKLIDYITIEKTKEYEFINQKIKELENKTAGEPVYKVELEKNGSYKNKIEEIEKKMIEVTTQVEVMELSNDFLIKKKEAVILERKKLSQQNEDLKRELEAKTQLNDQRIQKKVKENNSEDLQKLDLHSQSVYSKILELEGKLYNEGEKIKSFSSEIIKLGIDLKLKEEKRDTLVQSVDDRLKEFDGLKMRLADIQSELNFIKSKIGKEKEDNHFLTQRFKILAENHASVLSNYDYILKNYDYTTNLKKISMDDFRNLTQTNCLVNDSIGSFVNKIGSFKNQNLQNIPYMNK